MNKREWSIVFLPLVVCWVVDRVTKAWASHLMTIQGFGFGSFILHHNPGAMLGLFSELPPVLRVVTLSTGGAFLVCTYALIQYLLPIKSLTLRSGLSILLGGILGNVTDRIVFGSIVDFIVIGTGKYSSPAFNIADAVQWVGYGMVIYAIVKEGEILWPENNARKAYWINPSFQLKYSFLLAGLGLGISLISLVFSYTYLRVTMIELVGNNQILLDKFLLPFAITFSVLSVATGAGLFTIGKLLSHKVAGPLYAFERFMNDTMDGKEKIFKLRAKDDFKELEILAHRLQVQLKDRVPRAPEAEAATTESSADGDTKVSEISILPHGKAV